LDLQDAGKLVTVSIFDQSGRLCSVSDLNGQNKKIDVSSLIPGFYFMKVVDGNHSRVVKIVRL
jgi:hypothetical protein